MSRPGMGAMIHQLSGGSRNNASDFYGQKIVAAELKKADDESRDAHDALILEFADGRKVSLWDDGQSCCEHRYMTIDDDLSKIVGGTLTRIECKEGRESKDDDYSEHEQVFIEIGTDDCFVTLCTHNEHNGYYGGFGLTLDLL